MARTVSGVKAFALAVLLLVFAVPASALTLDDLGCSKTAEGWLCPKDPVITADIVLTNDVVCLSSNETAACTTDCAALVDIGCYSTMKPAQPLAVSLCADLIKTNETLYDYSCTTQTVSQEYDALINPEVIDYSQCSKTTDTSENSSLYVITCPFAGRTAAFSGSFVNETFYAAGLSGLGAGAGFDLAALLSQNAAYLLLLILLAAVAWWAFRPGGPAGGGPAAPRRKRRERYV